MKYDVFISCKSEDYDFAGKVYDFLTSKGIHVFLASKELDNLAEAAFSQTLDEAIDGSSHMIVIASDIRYLDSRWVRHEWRTFSNDVKSGFRKGNLITILGPGADLKDLPASLRYQQSFTFNNYQKHILPYLSKLEGEAETGTITSQDADGDKKSFPWHWIINGSIVVAVIVLLIIFWRLKDPVSPTAGSGQLPHPSEEKAFVDLGLSVKWADSNLGADNPTDCGDYFSWGETSSKGSCSWKNYSFRTSGVTYYNVKLSKYNTDNDRGPVDGKTRLEETDDAAYVILGGSWRMPTSEEWSELRRDCTWEWTTNGTSSGYTVTSKINGNSIFLPAAGCRLDSHIFRLGAHGYYWSSSLTSDFPISAWYVTFNSVDDYGDDDGRRYRGFSIRPVTN